MLSKDLMRCVGLAAIAGVGLTGCGGSGASSLNDVAIPLKGGLIMKVGTAQADATATDAPLLIKVKIKSTIVDAYLPAGASVKKGDPMDVIWQESAIIKGLRPTSPDSTELLIGIDGTNTTVSTGLFMQADGTFDVKGLRAPRAPKSITVPRRKDTINWFPRRIVFQGEQQLVDTAGHVLDVKNGIVVNTWDQAYIKAGLLDPEMTYGQPAWAGTIPANGGSATGTSVQFTMPKRASDGEVIYKNWPATLTIIVNSKYSYTQDKFANDQGVIAFTNETYQ
jgi:hypothetical protein